MFQSLFWGTLVVSALSLQIATAQNTPAPKEEKPLELPEFIITGSQNTDVPGGTKQEPNLPPRLKKAALDSLNTLEKQPPPPLTQVVAPRSMRTRFAPEGYLQGEFGSFISPALRAGWRTSFDDYDFLLHANAALSDGHLDNANFTRWGIDARLVYHAPEKFYILGGSRTETFVQFRSNDYRLFASTIAPERSVSDITVGVNVDGDFEQWQYKALLALESASLQQQNGTARDISLSNTGVIGSLRLLQQHNNVNLGGIIALDFRGLRDVGQRFIEAGAVTELSLASWSLNAAVTVQNTANSLAESQWGVGVQAHAVTSLSPSLQLELDIASGREKTSYKQMLTANPYLSHLAEVVFTHQLIGISGALRWQPDTQIGGTLKAGFKTVDDMPLFTKASPEDPSITVLYQSASLLSLEAESVARLSDVDNITLQLHVLSSSQEGNAVPYIPTLSATAMYARNWSSVFSTTLRATYRGERQADIQNTVALPAYVDIGFEATYRVLPRLIGFVRGTNLLGADIVIWEGFRERGLFLAAGLTWSF